MLISFFANVEPAFIKGFERLNSNNATPKNDYIKYSLFKFEAFLCKQIRLSLFLDLDFLFLK